MTNRALVACNSGPVKCFIIYDRIPREIFRAIEGDDPTRYYDIVDGTFWPVNDAFVVRLLNYTHEAARAAREAPHD